MSAGASGTARGEEDERFLVARDDKVRCRLLRGPSRALESGEVRLRVERFGMTANNVTYAALNRTMPYFHFFPDADSADWGVLPVWGIARVDESRHDGVLVGTRFFGFFPAARFVTLAPVAVRETGFRVERANIPPEYALYNHYQRTDTDPFHLPDQEDALVVVRPLFFTALALGDYLSSGALADVETIVISSASSKTAYGLASALRARRGERRVIGLSSRTNVPFVESLRVYDRVEPYEGVARLAGVGSAVHVDIAGSFALRATLREQLRAGLRLTLSVGMTHGEAGGYSLSSGEPATEAFFAPGWIARRRQELGLAFLTRSLEGWRAQMDGVERRFPVHRLRGGEALRETYRNLVRGCAPASAAYVVEV